MTQVIFWDPNAEGPSLGDKLRQAQPTEIFGQKITRIDDLKSSLRYDLDSNTETPISLPSSDVLTYFLADGSRIIVRPSGTEPKVKCYYEIIEELSDDEAFSTGQARANERLNALISAHQGQLSKL